MVKSKATYKKHKVNSYWASKGVQLTYCGKSLDKSIIVENWKDVTCTMCHKVSKLRK